MEILEDNSGHAWELTPIGEDRVQLQSKRYGDNIQTYSRAFIESAIKDGLFERINESEATPMELHQKGGD